MMTLRSQGTPNRTPWSPDLDFNRFFMDFGMPFQFWSQFGDFFVVWPPDCSMDSRVGFSEIWEWTSHQDVMPGCVENAVNTVVFVRFPVLKKLEF